MKPKNNKGAERQKQQGTQNLTAHDKGENITKPLERAKLIFLDEDEERWETSGKQEQDKQESARKTPP